MKTLYILPGWSETTRRRPYIKLAKIAEEKGYRVVRQNIDWNTKLSKQFFPFEKDSVIFGFSLGAVMARLLAQQSPCKHIILASMTPLDCFSTNKEMKKALVELLGKPFVEDVAKHLTPHHLAEKQTVIYGDKEGESVADIFVPNTEHEISDEYLEVLWKIL